jgi:hypothetical protein
LSNRRVSHPIVKAPKNPPNCDIAMRKSLQKGASVCGTWEMNCFMLRVIGMIPWLYPVASSVLRSLIDLRATEHCETGIRHTKSKSSNCCKNSKPRTMGRLQNAAKACLSAACQCPQFRRYIERPYTYGSPRVSTSSGTSTIVGSDALLPLEECL